MGSIPQNLDWIAVRNACTLAAVFSELRFAVEGDANKINAAHGLDGDEAFTVKTIEPNGFVVYKVRHGSNKSVRFFLEADRIEIHDDFTGQKYAAGITLTNEGRCKMRIAGEELEQWQVRRMALETLFFG